MLIDREAFARNQNVGDLIACREVDDACAVFILMAHDAIIGAVIVTMYSRRNTLGTFVSQNETTRWSKLTLHKVAVFSSVNYQMLLSYLIISRRFLPLMHPSQRINFCTYMYTSNYKYVYLVARKAPKRNFTFTSILMFTLYNSRCDFA